MQFQGPGPLTIWKHYNQVFEAHPSDSLETVLDELITIEVGRNLPDAVSMIYCSMVTQARMDIPP